MCAERYATGKDFEKTPSTIPKRFPAMRPGFLWPMGRSQCRGVVP